MACYSKWCGCAKNVAIKLKQAMATFFGVLESSRSEHNARHVIQSGLAIQLYSPGAFFFLLEILFRNAISVNSTITREKK